MAITKIPENGWTTEELKNHIQKLREQDIKWQNGRSFALVYYPGKERYEKIKEIFNIYISDNGLNPTVTPSLTQMERDILSISTHLMNGDNQVRGSLTSGGTESIFLAVKTAKDWAKDKRKINNPHIVISESAHPAFQKAFQYLNIEYSLAKNDINGAADVKEIEKLIRSNTVLIVISAPSYPYGIIDPVAQVAQIAKTKNILLHVDACVGGYILPFLEKLGVPIPAWDFRVDGVTSISADLHKYGYASKGASVVLYKNSELRKYQFCTYTGWIGGVYGTPTFLGTRPGGSIAGAWATLVGIGLDGYLEMAKVTLQTTQKIMHGLKQIPEIEIIGDPITTLFGIKSDKINMYELADELNKKGWHFDKLQNPAGIHLTINYIHKDSADAFLEDVREGVETVKKFSVNKITNQLQVGLVKGLSKILPQGTIAKFNKAENSSVKNHKTAAMYGMMGALSGTEDLEKIVLDFLDGVYSPQAED